MKFFSKEQTIERSKLNNCLKQYGIQIPDSFIWVGDTKALIQLPNYYCYKNIYIPLDIGKYQLLIQRQ